MFKRIKNDEVTLIPQIKKLKKSLKNRKFKRRFSMNNLSIGKFESIFGFIIRGYQSWPNSGTTQYFEGGFQWIIQNEPI